MKTLANSYLKPFQLKQHLNNAHKYQDSKLGEQFESKEGYLKCVRLDAGSPFKQASFSIVKASYAVAFCIAIAKKSHIFVETLVKG